MFSRGLYRLGTVHAAVAMNACILMHGNIKNCFFSTVRDTGGIDWMLILNTVDNTCGRLEVRIRTTYWLGYH